MFTTKDPTHCPKCMSEDIFLWNPIYQKDAEGKDTDIVILGMWLCNACGEVIGRKMNQYENDVHENSV